MAAERSATEMLAAVRSKPHRGAAPKAAWMRAGGVGLLALLLAACASSKPAEPPACPTTLILDGAQRTISYRPDSDQSPSALRYMAALTNLRSTCHYNDKGVDVDLAIDLIAQRGPAAANDSVPLTYFVATMGPNRKILSKQLLDSEIAFTKGEKVAGVTEQLTLRLPSVTPEHASDYSLLLGFQLPDAELKQRQQPLLP
jgi:hypothetical protein